MVMNTVADCRHGKLLFSTNDTYVGKALSLYGEYSEIECRLLCHLLKEGNTVVEVGANIGSLTVPMSKAVGRNGMVFAFEPQRTTFYCLCGNVFLNNLKNTFCFPHAVGDKDDVILIPDIDYDIVGNYGSFSIAEKSSFEVIPNRLPVEMHPLDAYKIQECSLLKIDVEGMELQVLKGAEQLISEKRPILYVENDRNDKRDEVTDWILSRGYECWQHFPRHYNPENFKKEEENVFGEQVSANLLAFTKESGLSRESFADFELLSPDIKITVVHK